jgi:hypothetical protein
MTPTPTTTQESRLDLFLDHLGALLKVLAPVGLAVAAPFIKSTGAKAIVSQEAPVVSALADELANIGKE